MGYLKRQHESMRGGNPFQAKERRFLSTQECYEILKNSSYFVKNCFEQEQRFNGSSVDEWQTAGIVSLSHIILPFIIMLIVHLYFVATAARFSWKRLFTIPVPLVSKLVAFVYQVKICKLNGFKEEKKQEILKLQEKLLTNLAFINITIVIEAAIESCFQFCFQAVYRMPSLFISFMTEGQGFQWKDLVNWGTFSVVISFASFAWTFTSIRWSNIFNNVILNHCIIFFRNRTKEEALNVKSIAVLILKTMFDATSRILIFSIWMYVSNQGQFSSMSTLTGFYILVAVLVVFNLVFSRRLDLKSFSFWTGGNIWKHQNI